MTGDACRRRSPLACDADPRGRPHPPSCVRTAVPQPIEIKLYSDHKDALIQTAKRVADAIGAIPGVVDVSAGVVKTLEGSDITITTDNGVMVNNAKVIKTDVMASNGVIHVIDTVLMPN